MLKLLEDCLPLLSAFENMLFLVDGDVRSHGLQSGKIIAN